MGMGVILVLFGALELFPEWNDQRDDKELMLARVWGRQSLGTALGVVSVSLVELPFFPVWMEDAEPFVPLGCTPGMSGVCTRVLDVRILAESPAVEPLAMVLLL